MTIIVEQDTTSLIFRLVGDTYATAKAWEDTLDSRVFKHEIATGLTPSGRPVDDTWLKVAHLAQDQGIRIPPWYGSIQGAYSYEFRFLPNSPIVHCSNSETGDTLELTNTAASTAALPIEGAYLGFPIDGQSYFQLSNWEHWDATQACSSRYHYRFVPTTVVGIARVYDSISRTEIDITDYGED